MPPVVVELDTSTGAFEHASHAGGHAFANTSAAPRSGHGARLIRALVRGYGEQSSTRAVKLACEAAEAYNDWIFHALDDGKRRAWLGRDLRRMTRSLRKLGDADKARFERVLARVVEADETLGDRPLYEGVTYARALVAAAVLIGALGDELHAMLDRYAVTLGTLWEIACGGQRERASEATRQARQALAALPASTEAEELTALVDQARWSIVVGAPAGPRRFSRCDPERLPFAPRQAPSIERSWAGLGAPVLNGRLAAALDRELDLLVSTGAQSLSGAVGFLRQQGGKRLRPTLTLLAAAASGGDPQQAVRVAALVEWLHQSSLVIDDMVDEAPRRRGVPTLHTLTSPPHAALVVGFILRRLATLSESEPARVRDCLYDAAVTLADGERLELGSSEAGDVDRTAYMHIIEAKTARLFSCAAMVGAFAVAADASHVRALGAFGKHAGIAFQIVDDALDYAGDERELGKVPGTDHTARKVTLPVLLLAEHDRCEPRELLDRPFFEVRQQMIHLGVPQACLDVARRHLGIASAKLAPLPDPAALRAFATCLVERRA
jgi:geranylgeranyl pyrophosphate synthase